MNHVTYSYTNRGRLRDRGLIDQPIRSKRDIFDEIKLELSLAEKEASRAAEARIAGAGKRIYR